MKAKKIIIIALSALVVALIVALVSVSIAAGNENLSIAEYFAKIAKNEKLDESTLVIIKGEEKSIESFEEFIRLWMPFSIQKSSKMNLTNLSMHSF